MKPQRYLPHGPYDFSLNAIKSIPECCGMFALYNGEGCVRIGLASNLRWRILKLCEHPDDCVKRHWPTSVEVDLCTAFEIEKRWAVFREGLEVRGIHPVCGLES
jgi:hypothetical protein